MGHLAPTPFSDAAGPSPNDSPHLGALVGRLLPGAGREAMPASVTMPWTVAHPAAPGGRAPGQNAGWLGKAYDPFRVDGDPNQPGFRVEGLTLPEGVDPARFAERRKLLAEQPASTPSALPGWDTFQARALDALASALLEPRLTSRKSRRSFATSTAGTSTASACSWPAGSSSSVCRW